MNKYFTLPKIKEKLKERIKGENSMEKMMKEKEKEMKKMEKKHHSGKGTRTRINTAAEKTLFRSNYS